jgi:hypothetical protein
MATGIISTTPNFGFGIGAPPPPPPTPQQQQYGTYQTAVQQQAGDYSGLMDAYKQLATKAANAPTLSTPGGYAPERYSYTQTPDQRAAIANLGTLSQTGGFSDQDLQNIRSRAISPIRAYYANAQRELDRSKSLQGGYSPNYAAASAKMARDQSMNIADQTTNVNAQIAQMVAANKMAAASPYASAAAHVSDQDLAAQAANAQAQNLASQFNIEIPLQYQQANLAATQAGLAPLAGMSSLYGTTPALSSLFGQQAMQGAQLQNMISQQGAQNQLGQIGALISALKG